MKELIKQYISHNIDYDFILEKPRDKNLAHYATPLAFSLAKSLKKAPNLIANELVENFKNCSEIFNNIEAINGYINFKISPKFLDDLATKSLKNPSDFAKSKSQNSDKILLEYISANPTGPLHIGHVRGAVYGDSLARIAKHLGYNLTTEYYINDAGNQIELLGVSILLYAQENLLNKSVKYPEKYYRGEYIEYIAKKALEIYGKEIFSDENILKLAELGKDMVLELIKADLKSANIHIENWVSEKSLYNKLDETISTLKKSGELYDKDNKTYIRSTALGDDSDRVVIRDDNRPTYLAGDIIYHKYKFDRGFKRCINIWGADHHGYIARIKAAIHFLGYDENELEVILMQMVSLVKNGEAYKMSKRAGTSILMSDVLEEIGSDALRFMFVSKKGDTHLEFDIADLKKEDSSNPLFYINYAHARINQIFTKAGKKPQDVIAANLCVLDINAQNLLFESLILNDILQEAFSSRFIHKITDYLINLSANFHKFYNENRVVGSEHEDAMLKLFSIVALSIRTGFSLLGIEAKDKM